MRKGRWRASFWRGHGFVKGRPKGQRTILQYKTPIDLQKEYYSIKKPYGEIEGSVEGGVGWIQWIEVPKNLRRKGYGEKLLIEAEDIMRKKGAKVFRPWYGVSDEFKALLIKSGYKKSDAGFWYKPSGK